MDKKTDDIFSTTNLQPQIFEVIKVAIENNYIHRGSSPAETAQNISEFARTLKRELTNPTDIQD